MGLKENPRGRDVKRNLIVLIFLIVQAVWRRVQESGMVNDYIGDSKFKSFVRCVAALPFLPLTELESTVKELKNWKLASKEQEFFCPVRNCKGHEVNRTSFLFYLVR